MKVFISHLFTSAIQKSSTEIQITYFILELLHFTKIFALFKRMSIMQMIFLMTESTTSTLSL